MNMNAVSTNGFEDENDKMDSHYMRQHQARATKDTPVCVKDIKEPMVVLIDHESKINLMSMDFHQKGKWSINTKHKWKIKVGTQAPKELHYA